MYIIIYNNMIYNNIYTTYKIDNLAYYILLLLYQFIIAPSTHFHIYIIISHVCWSYFAHTLIYHVMFIWKFTMISIHVCMNIAALQVSGRDPKACATSAVRPRLRYARAIGLSVGLGGLRRGRYWNPFIDVSFPRI